MLTMQFVRYEAFHAYKRKRARAREFSFGVENALGKKPDSEKTINRCTSLRVPPVPGSLVLPKKNHLNNSSVKITCSFPLNELTNAPTTTEKFQQLASDGLHRAH